MLIAIPLLDVAGYRRRTEIDDDDVDMFDSRRPGYIGRRIAIRSSEINARCQKRYRTPLGSTAPSLGAAGTSPPSVFLAGTPTLGCVEVWIQVTTPGALGVAIVQWSPDGGATWTAGVTTAATVALGDTGLVANFPNEMYFANNLYRAPTAVPEVVLGWCVSAVDVAVWRKRGTNASDSAIEMAVADLASADERLKECADSVDGLYELPLNDAEGASGVALGGPIGYSEPTPYDWIDVQAARAGRCR